MDIFDWIAAAAMILLLITMATMLVMFIAWAIKFLKETVR